MHTSLLRSSFPIAGPSGQGLRNYPPRPSPHSPYQQWLAKCRAPSLGSLISHRPGPPPQPSQPPMHCPNVPQSRPSPPGLSLTPHLSSLHQLCSTPSVVPHLHPPPPPSARPLSFPSSPLVSPKHSASRLLLLTRLLQPPHGFLSSPHSAAPKSDTHSSLPSPHFVPSPRSPPLALRSSPSSPGPWDLPPAHLVGKRMGLLTWRPQSSGAAAPSGRGGKRSPTGLPSQLVGMDHHCCLPAGAQTGPGRLPGLLPSGSEDGGVFAVFNSVIKR